MDALRRADNDVANAANRWQHVRHKLRHPFQHWRWKLRHPLHNQRWRIRNKLNYINPFFYLRRIKNNVKFMFTGRR
jgi:hypothetical protein